MLSSSGANGGPTSLRGGRACEAGEGGCVDETPRAKRLERGPTSPGGGRACIAGEGGGASTECELWDGARRATNPHAKAGGGRSSDSARGGARSFQGKRPTSLREVELAKPARERERSDRSSAGGRGAGLAPREGALLAPSGWLMACFGWSPLGRPTPVRMHGGRSSEA